MSAKPTVIIIPGAWHTVEAYGLLKETLESQGYPVIPVSLPSLGSEPPIVTLDPDIGAIRAAIKSVVDEGGEVVLVMHSYGSVPGVESAKGFSKKERSARGEKGGIIRLIYVASFILHEGGSQAKGLAGKTLWWWTIEGDYYSPINPEHVFYNDLTPSEQKFWASKVLKHHPYPLLYCEATYEGWREIPSTYILCENDQALPPEAQRGMIASTDGVVEVETCSAGHSPFLSQPQFVVDVIRKATE